MIGILLAATGRAAAETWTVIWTEDFVDASDWTLEAHWSITGGGSPPNSLAFSPGAQTGVYLGPTYRSAGGSVWDDSTYDVLRIELTNVMFPAIGGSENRQLAWVLADSGANHIPDQADAIADWMEIRLIDATCCGVVAWRVTVKDDGAQQADQDFTIPQFEDVDSAYPAMFANITLNTLLKRFWINWSFPGQSGAHTGTWTGDGPFAESDSIRLNQWGYSTIAGLYIDDITLHGNQTAQAPPPPPPPPPKRERIQVDFGYATSEFGTQFYDRSTGPGQNVEWFWSFGDGYGSNREHPFHSFMCRGNFTVQLEVIDEFGNNGTVSAKVQINETKPLCGVLTRGEEGLAVTSPFGLIGIPTAVFIVIAAVSAASLALQVEIPFYPRGLRLLLLFVSVVGLFFTLGFAGQLVVALGG